MQAKPWKHITKMHESVYYPVRVQATVALALAGALFVSQILQEQGAFSVPRPADRQGALKAPNRESGTELWSQLKTPNAGKQEGKVGGEKGGCSCSFSADFVFSGWVFFFFSPPSLVWRTFGSSLSVTLSICIWISENREQRHVGFFFLMKIREKNYPKITSVNNHANGWYHQRQSSVWRLKRQNTRNGGKCDAMYMGLFPW